MLTVFTRTARVYDTIYAFKDYQREAERIRAVIEAHARIRVRTLLDVGCGTGAHLQWLRRRYAVEGLDLDDGLLEVARTRCPEAVFHCADMAAFTSAAASTPRSVCSGVSGTFGRSNGFAPPSTA